MKKATITTFTKFIYTFVSCVIHHLSNKMAVRNTKISRDLLHNCKLFLSTTKAEPVCSINQTNPQEGLLPEPNCFRYVLADSNKNNLMSPVEVSKQFHNFLGTDTYLQPSRVPKFLELSNSLQDQPSVPRKGKKNTHAIRNYSTASFYTPNRFFASKRSGKGKPSHEDCPKKKCVKEEECPNFVLPNCETRTQKICHHEYVDPHCHKKFAPYPSFSESCAERLVDDPSECFQCPWKKCGGAANIKPQKKRKYHTSVLTHMFHTAVDRPVPSDFQYLPGLSTAPSNPCAKKDPCQRPPAKCPKNDGKKKEHCEPKKKKKNPCKIASTTWTDAYGLWSSKQDIIPDSWMDLDEKPVTLCNDGKTRTFRPPIVRRFKKEKNIRKCPKKPCCYPPNINRRNRIKATSVIEQSDHSTFGIIPQHLNESIDVKVSREFPSNEIKLSRPGDGCKKEESSECPPTKITPRPLDTTIDPRYKPGCCEKETISGKKRVKPKVFVPKKR